LNYTNEGPFLRTGDLGFIHDEELFVTGRLKDMIIIRGRNLYPQDLELTAERCHKALRPGCAVAFSIETATDEGLVLVQELRDPHQTGLEEIIKTIRKTVANAHGVTIHSIALVSTGSIPKTSSGKLQRQACRAAYIAGTLDAIWISTVEDGLSDCGTEVVLTLPHTTTEEKLVAIWSEMLNVEKVGIHDHFTDLGDSVLAARFLNRVRDVFQVDLQLATLFAETSNVAELARLIDELLSSVAESGIDGSRPG
jgi:hypothetical protein